MYKIKKPAPKGQKIPALYNIVEDYTEFDAPGNVTVCAMTESEDIAAHARILAESYGVPLDIMDRLLIEGGIHVYPATGSVVTRGLFQCWHDPEGREPKQTWLLDVVQYAEAEQLARSYGLPLPEAGRRVFLRTLPDQLRARLRKDNLGLDYKTLDPKVARAGPVKYIDFRKDWSPHFKRLCIMPDGRLVSTGGLEEFAQLQGISVEQGRTLLQEGGTLEVGGDLLACQIVNGQPAVARFNATQHAKAIALVEARGLHLMDALSEVAFNDPVMMGALQRKERGL